MGVAAELEVDAAAFRIFQICGLMVQEYGEWLCPVRPFGSKFLCTNSVPGKYFA